MAGEGAKLATGWLELTVSTDGAQKSITDGVLPGATAAGTQAGGLFGASFGKVLAAGAVVGAVVGGFKKLYEIGSVFDEVTDTIRVGTGATGEALEGLSESARNVGKTVPASFEAAGSVVADLNTRLGLTGGTLETVSSQYLEAGRILGQEVDIQGTTAAFSAFGIEGDAVSGAMDNLFRVSQATGVGMNELASAAQAQAPAMQMLGFSYEDTISLVGSLDKAGLNSTAVMSSMGKGLVKLAKDGEEPQAAFERVTGEIDTLLASGDKAGAIDLAAGIFGTKGAVQFIGAVESGTVAFDDLMAATGASGDTILGVAADTRDFAESWVLVKNRGLDLIAPAAEGVFSILSLGMSRIADFMLVVPGLAAGFGPVVSTIGGVFGQVFTALGPVFAALVPQVMTLIQSFSPLSLIFQAIGPILPTLVAAFIGLATSLGGTLASALTSLMPVLTTLSGTLVGVIGGLLGALLPVIVQLAGIMGPILGTVIAAILPLFVSLIGIVSDLLAAVLPLLVPIIGLIAPLVQLAGAILGPLIQLFVLLITPIVALAQVLTDLLVPVFGFVITVVGAVIGWIANLLTWVVQLITGSGAAGAQLAVVWNQTMGMFRDFFANTVGMFVDFITNTVGMILDFTSRTFGMFVDFGTNTIGMFVDFFANTVGMFVGFAANVGATVVAMWTAVTGFFSGFISGAVALVVDFITRMVGFYVGLAVSIGTTISGMWTAVTSFFSGFISGAVALVVDFISRMVGFYVGLAVSIGTTISGMWDSVTGFFSGFISGAVALVSDFINGLVAFYVGLAVSIITTVSDMWSQVTGFFSGFVSGAAGLIGGFVSNAVSMVAGFASSVVSFFSSMWNDASNAVSNGIGTAVGYLGELPGRAMSALGNMGSVLASSGRDLIQGFIDGIWDMFGSVGDAVGGVLDFASGFFPNSPAKRGPFSGSGWRAVKNAGLAIGEEFGAGLTESEKALDAQFDSMMTVPSSTAARLSSRTYGAAGAPAAQERSLTLQYTATGDPGLSSEEKLFKAGRRLAARVG